MRISLVQFLIIFISVYSCKSTTKIDTYNSIYTQQDSVLVIEKINKFKSITHEKPSERIVEIGKSFIGCEYVSHTLEVGENESLVVNLQQFDCTTFVETCLALLNTLNSKENIFNNYCNNLKNIRYRNNNIDGYLSRMHYFSEWITNNKSKGIVEDITNQLGGIPYTNEVMFMSTHVNTYRQLSVDSTLIETLKKIENSISSHQYFYIPKDSIQKATPMLHEGMIVAFTTGIKGLDIIHTGLLVKENDEIHLLHASSDFGKVMISEKSLTDYIADNKLQTGIMVLEPML